jgi:hypothetical protein
MFVITYAIHTPHFRGKNTCDTATSAPAAAVATGMEEEEVLQPLVSIWDCSKLSKVMVGDKPGWHCSWCGDTFKPLHATRATAHLTKNTCGGIKPCKGKIDAPYLARYQALAAASAAKKEALQMSKAAVFDYAEKRLAPAIEALSSKKKPRTGTPVPMALTKATESIDLTGKQPTLKAAFENKLQSPLAEANYAGLEMAIADFFHCCNIPDSAVESPQFSAMVLQRARLVDSRFKIPGRRKIGGELLDLNFESTMQHIKKELGKEAPTFGIFWMRDGATVKRMPLSNVLAMTVGLSPMTVAIIDATDQMKDGGKKDAFYIADYMLEVVTKFDPLKELTDIFYFDGVSNVQKGGQVLEVIYPRSYCLHGGEHVVSLFFDDLAKLPPIKV